MGFGVAPGPKRAKNAKNRPMAAPVGEKYWKMGADMVK